jgi:hypothetical protein
MIDVKCEGEYNTRRSTTLLRVRFDVKVGDIHFWEENCEKRKSNHFQCIYFQFQHYVARMGWMINSKIKKRKIERGRKLDRMH